MQRNAVSNDHIFDAVAKFLVEMLLVTEGTTDAGRNEETEMPAMQESGEVAGRVPQLLLRGKTKDRSGRRVRPATREVGVVEAGPQRPARKRVRGKT